MYAALILIPVIVYGLLTLAFVVKAGGKRIPKALVKAHLVVFTFITASTEALSFFEAISFPALLTAWLLFLLVCSVVAALFIRRNHQSVAWFAFRRPDPLTAVLVGAVGFILVATFFTAMVYPPNTWDSMTYHMPRVVHWISNGNVSFYPTADVRQNYLAPLAEFAIMHLQVLTDGDLFANLVQWISFVVLLCLSLTVAAELGLNKQQQLISAVVVATIPMAILQSSSTQNDLVVSAFLMSFALFMLRLRNELSHENVIFAAIGLGLALLAKGTAFLYGAGIGVALAVPILIASRHSQTGLIKASVSLLLIVFVALLINAGHFGRNYQLYGHPLSTETGPLHTEDHSIAALSSNIVRNGALHLGTPSSRMRRWVDSGVRAVLGSRVNDPKTMWAGATFEIPYTRHEDTAGNLIHMFVILLSVAVLPILWVKHHHTQAIGYTVGVLLAAVLFCWMLKWQPWASRLHTPFFAMAAPLIAIALTSDVLGAKKHICYLIVFLMVFYSIRFVMANNSRDLESLRWIDKNRTELYFENKPQLFRDYSNAIKIVQEAQAQTVGLYFGGDTYEYPFWALAKLTGKNDRPIIFRHVGVNNLSSTLNNNEFLPAYVIARKNFEGWRHAGRYAPVYRSNYANVFKKLE